MITKRIINESFSPIIKDIKNRLIDYQGIGSSEFLRSSSKYEVLISMCNYLTRLLKDIERLEELLLNNTNPEANNYNQEKVIDLKQLKEAILELCEKENLKQLLN